MIEIPLVTIERVEGVIDDGSKSLEELVYSALAKLGSVENVGGVIAATFSNPERFPALSVRVAAKLKLPLGTPAFDLQMACSAYPYAVYLAGRLAADTGKKVLVVDADHQSALVDRNDHATGEIFSDAASVSVIFSDVSSSEKSCFDFLTQEDEALRCAATGPIHMDGMKVFTFVATEVREWLSAFLSTPTPSPTPSTLTPLFIPHQANPYMIRQLAKSLKLTDSLLTLDPELKNPGSASIPLTIAANRDKIPAGGARALIAGFGAGFSASAGIVKIL